MESVASGFDAEKSVDHPVGDGHEEDWTAVPFFGKRVEKIYASIGGKDGSFDRKTNPFSAWTGQNGQNDKYGVLR